MTQHKQKDQMYTLLVMDVRNAYRITDRNKYMHLITFKDENGGVYQAEEVEDNPVSRFIKNLPNKFTVSTPGRNQNLDWVRFVSIGDTAPRVSNHINRENLFVAQVAFSNAVLLGMQKGWSDDEILEKAYYFAGNIKQMAKQLEEEEL